MQAPYYVLIVDADASRQADLHRLLTTAGAGRFSLQVERDSQRALDRCQGPVEERPDLVLLNVEQDGFDADDWLRMLRGQADLLPVAVLLVGDRQDDRRAEALLAAGVQDYLARDTWSADELGRALMKALARHRHLASLRSSEQHFRLLADVIPHIVWVADAKGQVEYVNQRWLDYTGMSLAESLGSGALQAIHPNDMGRIPIAMPAPNTETELELRLRRADGQYEWFLVRSLALRDPSSQVLKRFGASTNIDAQKRSQLTVAAIARLVSQLHRLDSPDRLACELVQAIADELGVDAVLLGEVTLAGPQATIANCWQTELTSGLDGRSVLKQLWAGMHDELAAGRTVVINDVAADWRTASSYAAGLLPAAARGLVIVLSPADERQMVTLVAVTAQPRAWASHEITLLEGLAAPARLALLNARTQQSLAHQEETLQIALDTAGMGTWDVDLTSWRVRRAASLDRLFGLPVAGDARSVEEYLAYVHPADLAAVRASIETAGRNGDTYSLEYRILRPDGQMRWLSARGRVVRNAQGQAVRLLGALVDSTDRRAAEEALRESEARFRLALQNSPIMVFHADRELRYTWVYNAILGLPPEKMIGKRDDELFAPETAEPLLAFKRAVLEQNRMLRRELDIAYAHRYARFDVTGEPIHDASGEIVGMTVAAMDITERTRAEERLVLLAEASRLLSSSLDYEETLQRVAEAIVPHMADWCAIDLLTPDRRIELMGVGHVDPAKIEWARELRQRRSPNPADPSGVANVIRTGKPEFYPEIDLLRYIDAAPDAETRNLLREVGFKSAIVVPLNARHQTLGAITMVWSDSDRRYDEADLEFAEELARRAAVAIDNARLYQEARAAEADLRALNETLEQRVVERTQELNRSNQELDQFAYVASHDLKAPLRAIDHLATWIEEDAGHLLPPRSREHLAKMRGRIERMEGLLDDLLTYSRAGRQRGDVRAVDTRALMARVVELVSPPEGFQIIVEEPMPTLVTLDVPLETVLRNLLGNAIKHHDKESGVIIVRARDLGDMLEFTVQDDGPGIEPRYHERIFQMFQTLRPRDRLEGSGIGLAVVKKIVEHVGGRVWVQSELGAGATFGFTWPKQV
ncbi:MAG TPA: PAS domain S-box protein [Caldilineaceae bacterium]|nr:PAS domain S-box protein [Caldilineaceae bacterium]